MPKFAKMLLRLLGSSRTLAVVLFAYLTFMTVSSGVHAAPPGDILCTSTQFPSGTPIIISSELKWIYFLRNVRRPTDCNTLVHMLTITAWSTTTDEALVFPSQITKLSNSTKLVANADASGVQYRLNVTFPDVTESVGGIEIQVCSQCS